MRDHPPIIAERSPVELIKAIRTGLAIARSARTAARATENTDIADGYWEAFDAAALLIVDALAEAEDGLMLIEVEHMFAAIYGRV